MSRRTVEAHLDERTADRLAGTADAEGRSPSLIMAVATRLLLDLSPAARRALISLDDCGPEEREPVTRLLGRAALKAREKAVATRVSPGYSPVTDSPLVTEEEIDAEAVLAARR